MVGPFHHSHQINPRKKAKCRIYVKTIQQKRKKKTTKRKKERKKDFFHLKSCEYVKCMTGKGRIHTYDKLHMNIFEGYILINHSRIVPGRRKEEYVAI